MKNHKIFGLFLVTGIAAYGQTLNLRGKISNPAGQAVAGAIVELALQKLKDTTGSDGTYAFTGTTGIGSRALPFTEHLALNGNFLELILSRSQPVKLEVFDVRGNLLKREVLANAAVGVHRWNVADGASSDNMRVVKATIGAQVRTFRHLPLIGSGYAAQSPDLAATDQTARLAKMAAAVDTLKITAPNFAVKSVALSSYDSTINVTMEASGGTGLKNPPVKSAGCGKATTVTTGKKSITSSGRQRPYIIDIPSNYDKDKPYRLFYTSHWINSTAEAVRDQNYYFLKPLATAANEPAIFIAPQSDDGTWDQPDHALFDDLLAYAKANLCIDESRVFATGFSFGGMITYSLATNHQKQIRAAVGIAPANYNIWLPSPKLKDPIAWMLTTGMSDGTCPWVNSDAQKRGAKYIALEKAADNGCTIPSDIPVSRQGSHSCYDFQGCKEGYPVKACTFNGGHTNVANDPNSRENWIPQESWKFFMQF